LLSFSNSDTKHDRMRGSARNLWLALQEAQGGEESLLARKRTAREVARAAAEETLAREAAREAARGLAEERRRMSSCGGGGGLS
jgi:hypothetical protein